MYWHRIHRSMIRLRPLFMDHIQLWQKQKQDFYHFLEVSFSNTSFCGFGSKFFYFIFSLAELINFIQPIYVWREDQNSRQNTIKAVIERANSKQNWPQIIIFAEGTCTNRSCLLSFKPGAFYPGVPIQPLCIRYPNNVDTVTWTWEGPGA